jgi:hypothetical protein
MASNQFAELTGLTGLVKLVGGAMRESRRMASNQFAELMELGFPLDVLGFLRERSRR